MSEHKIVTVKIKDEEKTIRQKFSVYEDIEVSSDDPTLKSLIKETMQDYSGSPEQIRITIALDVL